MKKDSPICGMCNTAKLLPCKIPWHYKKITDARVVVHACKPCYAAWKKSKETGRAFYLFGGE